MYMVSSSIWEIEIISVVESRLCNIVKMDVWRE